MGFPSTLTIPVLNGSTPGRCAFIVILTGVLVEPTVNVSDKLVRAPVVTSVTLILVVVAAVTVEVASFPSEAVETRPAAVAVEAMETEVVTVATGLRVKRPILFPYNSVK